MTKQILTVALFGEAERGDFHTAYFVRDLPELADRLGDPPPYSRGILMGIQALLYQCNLIFFRVREEGFSQDDYYNGLELLKENAIVSDLTALGVPGVGDRQLLRASSDICAVYDSILLTSEEDLYDYLTAGESYDQAA